MKLAVPLLLLVSTGVFAQSAPQGRPGGAGFAEAKPVMLGMMEKSLPAMEETRSCIEGSGNSQDLNRCAAIMLEFQRQARASMGIPEGGPHGKKPPKPEDLKLEWSPQLKQQMLKDIDRSIEGTRAMVGCLKSSDSGDQMEACMEKTGLMKKR